MPAGRTGARARSNAGDDQRVMPARVVSSVTVPRGDDVARAGVRLASRVSGDAADRNRASTASPCRAAAESGGFRGLAVLIGERRDRGRILFLRHNRGKTAGPPPSTAMRVGADAVTPGGAPSCRRCRLGEDEHERPRADLYEFWPTQRRPVGRADVNVVVLTRVFTRPISAAACRSPSADTTITADPPRRISYPRSRSAVERSFIRRPTVNSAAFGHDPAASAHRVAPRSSPITLMRRRVSAPECETRLRRRTLGRFRRRVCDVRAHHERVLYLGPAPYPNSVAVTPAARRSRGRAAPGRLLALRRHRWLLRVTRMRHIGPYDERVPRLP